VIVTIITSVATNDAPFVRRIHHGGVHSRTKIAAGQRYQIAQRYGLMPN